LLEIASAPKLAKLPFQDRTPYEDSYAKGYYQTTIPKIMSKFEPLLLLCKFYNYICFYLRFITCSM